MIRVATSPRKPCLARLPIPIGRPIAWDARVDQGTALSSAGETILFSSSTLPVEGFDVLSPHFLNVAGSVSSTKIVAWSRTSSMKDMRLGRSIDAILPACEE